MPEDKHIENIQLPANAPDVNEADASAPTFAAPTFDGVTGYTPIPIGGQAVLEGVMMRGKTVWAVAARDEQGEIHVEEYPLKSAAKRNKWMKLPVIRGIVALVESLALGTRSLNISARIAGLEEEKEGEEGKERESAMTAGMIATSVVMGIALAIGIFILLPGFITQLLLGGDADRGIAWDAVYGIASLLIFIAYVYLIGKIPELKRVFQYHGAEHKVIHAVENGDPLTLESAKKYNTIHNRCGTAFLFMLLALAIVVFSLVPVGAIAEAIGATNAIAVFAIRIGSRLLLLPLVAGLAYEVTVKWAAKHTHLAIVKVIMWPGLLMQHLTTSEPDDDMIEVALVATKTVLAAEQGIIAPVATADDDSVVTSDDGASIVVDGTDSNADVSTDNNREEFTALEPCYSQST